MAFRGTRVLMVDAGTIAKTQELLPTKAGKVRRIRTSQVRQIDPSEYNAKHNGVSRGQRVFDQCAHKMGLYAQIQPISKESNAYKLATQRG